MSTTEEHNDERVLDDAHVLEQPQTFARTFESEIVEGDGRTLIARIVPYGVEALVADPPDFVPYREAFERGAFERQLRAFDRVRVWLNFEHEKGLRGIVGHGAQLDDRADALYGHFRVHANADGDKALQLVDEGLLTGLSLEFAALRSKIVDGVTRRIRAHVDAVSLCRFPAYESAAVLAVREQRFDHDDDEVDESADDVVRAAESTSDATPAVGGTVPYPDELSERLRALGVESLQRIATTSSSWDGSPSRFTDEQYVRSTLVMRSNNAPTKERCSLPVLEPDGTLNVNALAIAANALTRSSGDVRDVTRSEKSVAARKLVRYYRAAGIDAPVALLAVARG